MATNDIDEDVDLDAVINQINEKLIEVQGSLDGVSLKEGSVTLETTVAKTTGGGFKLFVKGSKKREREISSTITYNFGTPEKKEKLTDVPVSDPLAQLIVQSAQQFKETGGIKGLIKKNFGIEVSFSIKKVGEFGVEFDLLKVGIEIGREVEKTSMHKISLKFELQK